VSVGKRAGWGIADQALSSATNFAASIVIAREASASGFGAFGVAFFVYLVVVGLTRAVAAEPFLVRHSSVGRSLGADDETRAEAESALGAAFACGVLGALPIGVGAAALGGTVADALWPTALLLPLLLVQDIARYLRVGAGRARRAVASDAAWGVLLVPAFWLAIDRGDASVWWLTTAWAATGALAGMVALGPDLIPSPRRALAWWRTQRDLGARYAGEFLAGSGARHVSFLLMGAVSGTTAVASVRAVQVLFGPLNVLLMGAQLVGVPEAVRIQRDSPERLRGFGDRIGLALAACALAVGVGVLLLPDDWGTELFGDSWAAGSELVGYQMAADTGAALVIGSLLVLRALGAAKQSLRARLTVAPLTVLGVVGGAIVDDAQGAMVGLVIAQVMAVIIWRTQVAAATPAKPQTFAGDS
jgi:hypothetical protein